MCIIACWELYGTTDSGKLPSSGAEYRLEIEQPQPSNRRFDEAATKIAFAAAAAESETQSERGSRTSNNNNNNYKNINNSGSYQHRDDADEYIISSLPSTSTLPLSSDPRSSYYEFTTWERDEGNGICPSCQVSEVQSLQRQTVFVEIDVAINESSKYLSNSVPGTDNATVKL
mmetsp:Transcript_6136/g.13253  ORF Transcript_6136/g.13253 Transcript_6136/m.13253 type:complete len:173 (+) Transcript_6136:301-819(+)